MSGTDGWENPGPNARYCEVCDEQYLTAEIERIAVGVWLKHMPCGHVKRIVNPAKCRVDSTSTETEGRE